MTAGIVTAAMLVGASVAVLAASGQQAGLSARDIMEKNFFATKVTSLRVETAMVLINNRGQQRERSTTGIVKIQPNGVDSKLVVKFNAPPDIKGTGVLQIEHSESDDDLWIYLPALRKSRRLVANNKKDSFVGSDFSYGDITLPKVDQYQHTLLRSEKIDEHDCYVVESVPATDTVKVNSGYSKKITWVRADNFVESKVEYYDLTARLLKTQRTGRHQLVEPDKGRWFVMHREMTNHQSGHRTTITASKAEAVAIPDDSFTTRFLERQ
jgi:outer membrane lipoprotein-sorting protein